MWMRIIASLIVLSPTLPAQGEFEVASVRPNNANDRIVTVDVGPGGRFSARGYTLVLLMQRAYGVMDWNVTGGPDWIRADRFDVDAKAVVKGNLTEAQLQPMLQKLLAERLNLKLHRASKEMDAYAMVRAKDGITLHPSADGEEHSDTFRLTRTGLHGEGITMRDFARFVGGKLGIVIVDKTSLPGAYDVRATWPEPMEQMADVDAKEELRARAIAAIQRQLGLRIAARKVAVELLVIDHADRATPN